MHLSKQSITLSVLAGALSLGMIGSAHAAEATANFQVSIKIVDSCTIGTTASDIAFGDVVRSEEANAAGTLTVNCSAGTPYSIGLNGGLNSGGDASAPVAGTRKMAAGGSERVSYDLYRDAGRSAFWGNTPGTSGNMLSSTGTAAVQTHNVYAKTLATNATSGTYTDTVIARVVY